MYSVKIVVLGGGIAGAWVAKNLDRDPGVEVTLIDQKEYFEQTYVKHGSHHSHTIVFQTYNSDGCCSCRPAVLRTIGMAGIEEAVNWVQKIVVKHSRYIKYGNIVIGTAREVTPDRVRFFSVNSVCRSEYVF